MDSFGGGYTPPSPSGAYNQTKETFLQRQRRLYGQQGQTMDAHPPTPPAQPATASGSSPVGADGRLTSAPPPAQPAAPQAPPNPAGANTPQAVIPQQPAPMAPPPSPYLQQQTTDAASYMMANPHTLSDENVAQMQAQQREQAAIMARDAAAQRASGAAARGTFGGGNFAADDRRASDALQASILASNRDVMLKKAQQDRADELAALGAGRDTLNSQYDNALRDHQLGIQEQLGLGGLHLDQAKLNEGGREFDLGHGLDIQKFFENQRQFNNDLGYRYTDLEQQQQNQLMNWLRSVYGA